LPTIVVCRWDPPLGFRPHRSAPAPASASGVRRGRRGRCGPCKNIAPKFAELARLYPSVVFKKARPHTLGMGGGAMGAYT